MCSSSSPEGGGLSRAQVSFWTPPDIFDRIWGKPCLEEPAEEVYDPPWNMKGKKHICPSNRGRKEPKKGPFVTFGSKFLHTLVDKQPEIFRDQWYLSISLFEGL